MFGFLCPILRFKDRMASLGGTDLLRITSQISRFAAMSSLNLISFVSKIMEFFDTHKPEEVAFSICSSKAELEVNQPAILTFGFLKMKDHCR